MRILFLITGLRLGGAEMQLLLLTKTLIRRGVELEVVSMEDIGVIGQRMAESGIKVHTLNIQSISDAANGLFKLRKIKREFRPDVLHSHMIHANIYSRIFNFFVKTPKLINTAHNTIEGSKNLMKSYIWTDWFSDFSTNVSEEAYDFFVKNKYFSKEKSAYIPNAIDIDKFQPIRKDTTEVLRKELGIDNDTFVFLAVGRLHAQKNYPLLIKAFQHVQEHRNKTCLLIAGEGSLLETLVDMVNKMELNEYVKFLGLRDDIDSLMNMSNTFVLTSDFEGFGLVVGEAMACKVPVISTDSGGVKEVMGGFGNLVPVNDEGALVEAMLNNMNTAYSDDYLTKARNYILNKYSISSVVDKWLTIYRSN